MSAHRPSRDENEFAPPQGVPPPVEYKGRHLMPTAVSPLILDGGVAQSPTIRNSNNQERRAQVDRRRILRSASSSVARSSLQTEGRHERQES
jgi:hypothetical protein